MCCSLDSQCHWCKQSHKSCASSTRAAIENLFLGRQPAVDSIGYITGNLGTSCIKCSRWSILQSYTSRTSSWKYIYIICNTWSVLELLILRRVSHLIICEVFFCWICVIWLISVNLVFIVLTWYFIIHLLSVELHILH